MIKRRLSILVVVICLVACGVIDTARPSARGVAWDNSLVVDREGIHYCGIDVDC